MLDWRTATGRRPGAATAVAGIGGAALAVTILNWQVARAGLGDMLSAGGGPIEVTTALTTLAAAAAALLGAWLTLGTLMTWVAVLCRQSHRWARPSARVALITSPACLRPALGALLAGTLTLGAVTAASASSPPGPTPPSGPGPSCPDVSTPTPLTAALPAPGWLPTALPTPSRGCARHATALVTSADRHLPPDDAVVVRRGDTLWHLAARSLGPGASAADIAAEWPRWWNANRRLIGADPDLLLPGMRLVAPNVTSAAAHLAEKVR